MYHKKSNVKFKNDLMEYVDRESLPKDFDDWLNKYPFKNYFYMFFRIEGKGKNKKYIGACQHCKTLNINLKPIKNGEHGTCPICHKKIKYKNEKFSKYISDRDYVAIVQSTNFKDTFVLRKFLIIKQTDYLDYEYSKHEMERCCIAYNVQDGFIIKSWYRIYNLDWAFGYYKKMSFTLSDIIWTYYKNLDCLLYNDYKYCCVKQYSKARPICIYEYLKNYRTFPQLEYFVKLKMFKFINDIINYGSYRLHFSKNKMQEILGLNGEYYRFALNLCKTLDFKILLGIRFLQSYNIVATKDNLKMALRLDDLITYKKENTYIFYKLGFNTIAKYLKESKCDVRDYFDYLRNCVKLKYNLEDTAVIKPKDLKKHMMKRISECNIFQIRQYMTRQIKYLINYNY